MKWFYDMQLHNDNKKLRQNPTIYLCKAGLTTPDAGFGAYLMKTH